MSNTNLEDVPSLDLMTELLRRFKCSSKPDKRLILIGISIHLSLSIEKFSLSFRFVLAVNSDPKMLSLNSSILSLVLRSNVVDAVFRVSFVRPYYLIGNLPINLRGFSYAVQDGDTLMPQCIEFFSYWRRKWEDGLYALRIFYCVFLVVLFFLTFSFHSLVTSIIFNLVIVCYKFIAWNGVRCFWTPRGMWCFIK